MGLWERIRRDNGGYPAVSKISMEEKPCLTCLEFRAERLSSWLKSAYLHNEMGQDGMLLLVSVKVHKYSNPRSSLLSRCRMQIFSPC